MKAHHIVVSLGMLALLLAVTLIGGGIQDESGRVEFGTWIPVAILIAGVLAWRFASRSKRVAAAHEPERRVRSEETASVPANSRNIRSVLLLVATGSGFVLLSWVCLIYLGSIAGEESQTTALMGIRIVTAAGTTVTVLLLSRSAAAGWSTKPVVLQLGVILQLVLAFVGLIILPVVALIVWNGHIDFKEYSHKLGLFLLLLPAAAVVFCLTRGGGSER